MTFYTNGNVTHAGWRKVTPPPSPWRCKCRDNPAYLANCLDCKERRDGN